VEVERRTTPNAQKLTQALILQATGLLWDESTDAKFMNTSIRAICAVTAMSLLLVLAGGCSQEDKDKAKANASNAIDKTSDALNSASDKVKDAARDAGPRIRDGAQRAEEAITNGAAKAWDATKTEAQKANDAIKSRTKNSDTQSVAINTNDSRKTP
jgi:hypothetical protein